MHPRITIYVFTAWPTAIKRLREEIAKRFTVILRYTWVGRQPSATILGKKGVLADTLISLIKMFTSPRLYRAKTVIVCHTGHYAGLIVGRILHAIRPTGGLYLFNFYIHGMGKRRPVQQILRWLFRQNLAIAVQSRAEYEYFHMLAPHADVRYVPFGQDGPKNIKADYITLGNYIFSGGYTNRDYRLLIDCASKLRHLHFVIACSRLNDIPGHVPNNVEVLRDIEFTEFHRLMAGSRLVVVPLRDDVGAAGQMVALAAMKFNKTVVYPNFDVLSQYFRDGESGVEYTAGNLESLQHAISSVCDDTEALIRIGANAYLQWKHHFTKECFDAAIARHIVAFVEHITSGSAPLPANDG
ncbi:MAG: glycosyltransferase [Acidobacteriaceae bacterium]